MKCFYLFPLFLFLMVVPVQGQYRKSIPVKAGEDIAMAYSPNGFYRFPAFSKTALYSSTRKGYSNQLFNYNILYDKILFINPRGDTLEMNNPTLFDSVVINQTIFYYREDLGFLEQVAAAYPLRLVKKTSVKIKPVAVGAYGGSTTTSAINKINRFVIWPYVYDYTVNEDVVLKHNIDWYWMGSGFSQFSRATRKNLLPMLSPAKRASAEAFLKQNKIDFDNEEDLVEVLRFLETQNK